jgi:GNAT superfamily N-acetyltransferase
MTDHPTVTTHGPEGAHALREPLLAVYAEGYAPHLTNPLRSPERHWARVAAYTTQPGFRLVTVHVGAELVGYALGHTLPPETRWWQGFLTPTDDPDLVTEDGQRTFAYIDMTVHPQHRRRGYAHLLHDTLLTTRPEPRATLVVEPHNTPLHTTYQTWGWTPIGNLRPTPDSPTYHVLLHNLPLTDG